MANLRFSFVGLSKIPKDSSKFGFVSKGKTGAGKEYLRMNLGVQENEHNMVFTELFGCVQDTIKTKDTDGNDMEFNWDDRFDEDIINSVANYRKTTVDFTGLVSDDGEELTRKDFVSPYDAIKYVADNSSLIKDKRIFVNGQFKVNPYKGKFSVRYEIQNIYLAKEDMKNGLFVVGSLFYNKDGFDKADWKTEKVLGLDAYVNQYINKDEGNKYIPQRFVLDCSKLDMENEQHKSRAEFCQSFMNVKGKKYVEMPWKFKVLNGSEEVEITEDMLTKTQKQSIELGLKTLDDFKKKTFGDRVQMFKLITPMIEIEGFEDGCVEVDDTNDEFEENIYRFVEDESLDEVMEKAEEKEETPKKEEAKAPKLDDDDLFG